MPPAQPAGVHFIILNQAPQDKVLSAWCHLVNVSAKVAGERVKNYPHCEWKSAGKTLNLYLKFLKKNILSHLVLIERIQLKYIPILQTYKVLIGLLFFLLLDQYPSIHPVIITSSFLSVYFKPKQEIHSVSHNVWSSFVLVPHG